MLAEEWLLYIIFGLSHVFVDLKMEEKLLNSS